MVSKYKVKKIKKINDVRKGQLEMGSGVDALRGDFGQRPEVGEETTEGWCSEEVGSMCKALRGLARVLGLGGRELRMLAGTQQAQVGRLGLS